MSFQDDIVRVLLVDDDEVDRASVRRALASRHARVVLTECHSGDDAIKVLEHESFACVLLDYLLPGTTALEFLPKLQHWLAGTPVIVLTGYGDEKVAVDLMKAGATDYITKDRVDGRVLERAIEQAVSLGEARRNLERAERARRVYLKRLRRLVEITPALYGDRTIDGRVDVAVSAAQALFAAEEAFIGIGASGDEIVRVTRGEAVETLASTDERWRALYDASRGGADADVHIEPWSGDAGQGAPQVHWVSLLSSGRKWMGMFGIRVTPPPPAFAELTESLFAQLGELIGVAMENALLYEETQRAIGARDAVMAVVSHDLRSPLNSFNLSLELLRESETGKNERPILDRMQRAVTHMNRLIEDLLDVSRIERDELKVSPSLVPVGVLLDELQSMCAPIAQAGKITLVIGERTDVTLSADRHRILQVLGNLVNNALKFSPRHGKVSIDATQRDGELVFSVSDEGPGISQQDLPRVFERFYRHGGNGLGLGLHISKAIIDAHGGRIWADSEPGKGARFSFTLKMPPQPRTDAALPVTASI